MTQVNSGKSHFRPNVHPSQGDRDFATAQRADSAHSAPPRTDAAPTPQEFRAALLGTVVSALQCQTFAEASSTLASRMQSLLGCRALAIAVRDRGTGHIRLASISPAQVIDRRSSIVAEIENVLREALLLDQVTAAPEIGKTVRTAAVDRLRSQWGGESMTLAAPLWTANRETVGSWVLIIDQSFFRGERKRVLLAEAAAVLATCVATLDEKHASTAARLLRRAASFVRSRRAVIAACIAVTCMFLGMLPWPYVIRCNGVCEPKSQRFIAAPFSGMLEEVAVAPGDLVERDQVLARLDGETLHTEIASAEAQCRQTRQRYDAALAAGEAGPATVERLKLQQLNAQLAILQSRRERLTIRSPVDGVVVSGDLIRAQGAPVTLGQALFEVAPLSQMLVEASIPEAEVLSVAEGMNADVRFEVESLESRRGVVQRIHPRAEIRDGKNVFIAEVAIEEGGANLRPGMRASVSLHAGRRRLAWIGFHRPFYAIRAAIGW